MRDYVIDFDVENIEDKLKDLVDELDKIDGVLAIYVFGSYISGKMHGLSDVDVCVVGNVSSEAKKDIFLGKFPEMFDVVFLEDLPIWIKIRIFQEGRCLKTLDEAALNLIKLSVIGEYLDFKPVIDDIVERELTSNV